MQEKKLIDRNSAKPLNMAASSTNWIGSIDTFHAHVHNTKYQALPSEMKTTFDGLEDFFKALDGII